MKFNLAYVPRSETYIVFTGSSIIQNDLSEEAAHRLCQFLNSHEYLNTDKKAKARNVKPLPAFDFEAIYALYPLRRGKKIGMERLRKTITTIDQYNLLLQATKNYAEIIATEKPKEQFIKHFSTFASVWTDFIPEECMSASSEQMSLSMEEINQMMEN